MEFILFTGLESSALSLSYEVGLIRREQKLCSKHEKAFTEERHVR
jgi:hypothetical protein